MHCVPYKSLQEVEELKAVAPLSSALQTAQFAYNFEKSCCQFAKRFMENKNTELIMHYYS